MTIIISNDIPDSTYFSMSDVAPFINPDGAIVRYEGKGTRRSSWGAPQVSSRVVVETETLISIHTGFSHKHRGGQGWHHFTLNGGQWVAVKWASLSDDQRQMVLDAPRPGWAKAPGKLRKEHATPSTAIKQTGFKIVAVAADGTLRSLYDRSVVYEMGVELCQRAADNHGGGWYYYPTLDGVKAEWDARTLVPEDRMAVSRIAVLEVEVRGNIVEYAHKRAATYLRPVRVVEMVNV